jgi:hypothetical protein
VAVSAIGVPFLSRAQGVEFLAMPIVSCARDRWLHGSVQALVAAAARGNVRLQVGVVREWT